VKEITSYNSLLYSVTANLTYNLLATTMPHRHS
jgi:hypothetical protein